MYINLHYRQFLAASAAFIPPVPRMLSKRLKQKPSCEPACWL